MSLTWPAKDPQEVLDYDLDWIWRLYSATELDAANAQLAAGVAVTVVPSDTIATSTWSVADGDVVAGIAASSATSTKIWLSAGSLDQACLLTNRVTTAGGRTMEQSVKLKIKAK
jgi:hypothetical protein